MKTKYPILLLALGVTSLCCCDEETFREETMPTPIFEEAPVFDDDYINLLHETPIYDFEPIANPPIPQEWQNPTPPQPTILQTMQPQLIEQTI